MGARAGCSVWKCELPCYGYHLRQAMKKRKNVSYTVAHHVNDMWKNIDLKTDLQVTGKAQDKVLDEIWHRVNDATDAKDAVTRTFFDNRSNRS